MRILITGVSGLLGSNLAVDYAAEHQVVGVFHRTDVHIDNVGMVSADLSEPAVADKVIEKVHPDWVVHCAAATQVDDCQRNRDWAMRHNRDMAGAVAAAAHSVGAGLVHISTDAVYSGDQTLNHEDDEPAPRNIYGESKLAGEVAVLNAHPSALIIRTNLFGIGRAGVQGGLLAWFLQKFAKDEIAPGFTDIHFSPILVSDLGGVVLELIAQDAAGVLNVGGSTCLSKYEFGQAAAVAFGYSPTAVRPTVSDQASLHAPRPKQLCLDNSRAQAMLGRHLPGVEDGLRRLAARSEFHSRSQAQAVE